LTLLLSGAIACYKFDKYRINKYIQNKVTQCAKNDASFVRNSEKVGTQSPWPCFLAHPVGIFLPKLEMLHFLYTHTGKNNQKHHNCI